MYLWTRKLPFNFGSNPGIDPDPGITHPPSCLKIHSFIVILLFSLHLFYGYAQCNLATQATETNKCDLIWFINDILPSGEVSYSAMDCMFYLEFIQ